MIICHISNEKQHVIADLRKFYIPAKNLGSANPQSTNYKPADHNLKVLSNGKE